MAYSREEQETTLVYDALTDAWHVYSTVPKHMRKLMEIGDDVHAAEHDAAGNIIAVQGSLTTKQVSMKKERVLTEEQRQALSERMKNFHNGGGE